MFVANGVTAYISENMEIIIFGSVFIFSLEEEKNHRKHHVCKFYFYSHKNKNCFTKTKPNRPQGSNLNDVRKVNETSTWKMNI